MGVGDKTPSCPVELHPGTGSSAEHRDPVWTRWERMERKPGIPHDCTEFTALPGPCRTGVGRLPPAEGLPLLLCSCCSPKCMKRRCFNSAEAFSLSLRQHAQCPGAPLAVQTAWAAIREHTAPLPLSFLSLSPGPPWPSLCLSDPPSTSSPVLHRGLLSAWPVFKFSY